MLGWNSCLDKCDLHYFIWLTSFFYVILQDKGSQRKQDLEDSLQAQQYFADANEAESWMREKEPIASNTDYGKDEDSAEALLKKHEAFMSDLEAYRTVIEGLHDQAQSCKVCEWFVSVCIKLHSIFCL